MSNVRLRRLTADHAKLREYVRLHPRVRLINADGDPPERYQLEYRIRSLRMVDGELRDENSHLVEIHLPRNYPRTPPVCRMLSPVFHPNIAPHAICVGDHWGSGEPLQSIVTRIGEMLAYQSYNVKSPLNGEAARWVEENKQRLPLDPVSLLPEDEQQQGSPPQVPAPPAPPAHAKPQPTPPKLTPAPDPIASPTFDVTCRVCQTAYRVKSELKGKKIRCKKCQTVFEI